MTPQRHELLDFLQNHFRSHARPVLEELGVENKFPNMDVFALGESDMISMAVFLADFLKRHEAEESLTLHGDEVDMIIREVIGKLNQMDKLYATQLLRIFSLLVSLNLGRSNNVLI
jgi:hypothetical protein